MTAPKSNRQSKQAAPVMGAHSLPHVLHQRLAQLLHLLQLRIHLIISRQR